MATKVRQTKSTRQRLTPGQKVVKSANKIYRTVVKYHCKHGNSATNYKQLVKSKHRITCNGAISLTLQEAGILNKNEMIGHKGYGKMFGLKYLKTAAKKGKCKVIIFKKKKLYKNIPKKYKKAGCVYIYNHTAGVNVGNNIVYQCNRSGKSYSSMSQIKHNGNKQKTTKYFTIQAVIIPI